MKNTKIRTSSRAASSSSSLRLRICFGGGPPGFGLPSTLISLNCSIATRLAVFENLEVVLRQVRDWLRLLVGDDDVDADEVDAAAEHGLLRVALLAHWLACWPVDRSLRGPMRLRWSAEPAC